MPPEPRALYKLGGISFLVSGVLFLSKAILDFLAGPAPSNGAEILAWAASRKFSLAMTNELLFVAVTFLVPAVIALHHSLAGTDGVKAAVGCGIVAMAIPVMAVLDIVHGRLVFPVYDIPMESPTAAELVVAVYHGGMHAVLLLLGIATIVLGLAMRRGAYGRYLAILGIATGVVDVIGSYPWVIGSVLTLVSQAAFAAWFLAVGAKLHGMAGPRLGPSQAGPGGS